MQEVGQPGQIAAQISLAQVPVAGLRNHREGAVGQAGAHYRLQLHDLRLFLGQQAQVVQGELAHRGAQPGHVQMPSASPAARSAAGCAGARRRWPPQPHPGWRGWWLAESADATPRPEIGGSWPRPAAARRWSAPGLLPDAGGSRTSRAPRRDVPPRGAQRDEEDHRRTLQRLGQEVQQVQARLARILQVFDNEDQRAVAGAARRWRRRSAGAGGPGCRGRTPPASGRAAPAPRLPGCRPAAGISR